MQCWRWDGVLDWAGHGYGGDGWIGDRDGCGAGLLMWRCDDTVVGALTVAIAIAIPIPIPMMMMMMMMMMMIWMGWMIGTGIGVDCSLCVGGGGVVVDGRSWFGMGCGGGRRQMGIWIDRVY